MFTYIRSLTDGKKKEESSPLIQMYLQMIILDSTSQMRRSLKALLIVLPFSCGQMVPFSSVIEQMLRAVQCWVPMRPSFWSAHGPSLSTALPRGSTSASGAISLMPHKRWKGWNENAQQCNIVCVCLYNDKDVLRRYVRKIDSIARPL